MRFLRAVLAGFWHAVRWTRRRTDEHNDGAFVAFVGCVFAAGAVVGVLAALGVACVVQRFWE
jgi:hypothetical protein